MIIFNVARPKQVLRYEIYKHDEQNILIKMLLFDLKWKIFFLRLLKFNISFNYCFKNFWDWYINHSDKFLIFLLTFNFFIFSVWYTSTLYFSENHDLYYVISDIRIYEFIFLICFLMKYWISFSKCKQWNYQFDMKIWKSISQL